MTEFIDKKTALSFPFANGQYDHQNANPHFIYGCETYKEWLETLPAADVVEVVRCQNCKFGDGNGVEYLCRKHSGSEKVLGEDKNYSEWHPGHWFCADGDKE